MIQRIQSVWLLLASVTIFLMLIIPIFIVKDLNAETWLQGTGIYTESEGVRQKLESISVLMINIIVVGILCLAAIFNFRNRSSQKKVIFGSILLIFSLTAWVYISGNDLPGGIAKAEFGAGAFLPLLALLFCVLALRGIRKDEQLLKSADRLR